MFLSYVMPFFIFQHEIYAMISNDCMFVILCTLYFLFLLGFISVLPPLPCVDVFHFSYSPFFHSPFSYAIVSIDPSIPGTLSRSRIRTFLSFGIFLLLICFYCSLLHHLTPIPTHTHTLRLLLFASNGITVFITFQHHTT